MSSGSSRTARPVTQTVADVFTVRGGLVVHMQAYADPEDVPG
jgi:ketosteroid isomerase-like protein